MSPADEFDVLREGFLHPPAEYSPVGIWWWTGERVELDRLCEQLDRLAEQGVHNVLPVNLAPAGPQYGAQADDPPLFSADWWELWRGICEHARGLGTRIWFYDQFGFGASNTQGQIVTAEPSFAGAALDRLTVDTADPIELTCPPTGDPIAACALRLDDDGAVSGPPIALDVASGTVAWDPAAGGQTGATYRVMLAFARREGFDYLSVAACARLLDAVHGEFERHVGKYFGEVIAGSFQDELPDLPTWSGSFAAEFADRCGYRIETVIGALWEDWGADSDCVRVDYQTVRAALAEDALFEPLWRWHDERGMIFGCDQQSPSRAGEPRGCVRQYADYCRTHRWFSAPGSDQWGDAKLHSSLAHHYERPRTWIEAFHTSGWGGTLEETFDWVVPWLLAGANLYSPHAVYYSTHGGWWEWAPPSTCWRQPYWRHYGLFAGAVTRLFWAATRGRHVCDVGVLFPTTAVQAGTVIGGILPAGEAAHRSYLEVVGHMTWFYTQPGSLGRAALDFDVLDDDTIVRARAADGKLQTATESYRAVIVPRCRVLLGSTVGSLVRFAESGGTLVFVGALPEVVLGDDASQRRLGELLDDGRVRVVDDEAAVTFVGDDRDVVVEGVCLRRRVGAHNVLIIPAAPTGTATTQPMMPWVAELAELGGGDGSRLVDGYLRDTRELGYEFVTDRYRSTTTVRIDSVATDVEQWDVCTGRPRPAAARVDEGVTEVEVDFSDAPIAMLVWRDGSGDVPGIAASAEATREVSLDGMWESTVVRTIDNAHGDLAWPPADGPFPVQQWRVRHRVEQSEGDIDAFRLPDHDDAAWSEELVGFGPWAWRFGPVAADNAPAPLVVGHRGRLDDRPGWEPVRYSLTNGIEKDPIHARSLGPKGRVPDDFWHVPDVPAGEVVCLRSALPVAATQAVSLAVAANGETTVWWNGERLADGYEGHLRLESVQAEAGFNLLEIHVRADVDGPLRGFWALTNDPESFVRPHWLVPGDGVRPGTIVTARSSIRLAADPTEATLQLGTDGVAKLLINGREVASQGGFDPYGSYLRVIPYQVGQFLHAGDNELVVEIADSGNPVALFIDGFVTTDEGRTTTPVVTDESWILQRDGEPVATRLRRSHSSQPYDSQWARLRPRPHPLPRAGWLEAGGGSASSEPTVVSTGVLDIVPDATPGITRPAEWFRVDVPPGATRIDLPQLGGAARLWVDGEEVHATDGAIELPSGAPRRRTLAARIEATTGASGGALWAAPLEFEVGAGEIDVGDWSEFGLGSYSGGISYRRVVCLDDAVTGAVLDLGAVRGSAEVTVNGTLAGVRVWSPYTLDIAPYLGVGDNEIVVTVFNTLAPYLDDASPTRMVYPGQRRSGLFGPVRLATR